MSVIDFLPSYEKTKRRARMRSPEEYEKLREKVKSPERIAEEMDKNEQLAELNFALETEPTVKEELKKAISEDLQEQGIDGLLENTDDVSDEVKQAIDSGQFDVGIDTNPEDNTDQVTLYPEGRVSEKLPIKKQFSEQYAAHMTGGDVLNMMTLAVYVEDKLCAYMDVLKNADVEHIIEIAKDDPGIKQCLNGRAITEYRYEPEKAVYIDAR